MNDRELILLHRETVPADARERALEKWRSRTPDQVEAMLDRAERIRGEMRLLALACVGSMVTILLGVWWIADVCLRQMR